MEKPEATRQSSSGAWNPDMGEDDLIAFVADLPDVTVITASADIGAPEIAWGDSFFYYDPDGSAYSERMPFATVVTKDYPGFDTASDVDRPGVFRLNIAVGRDGFREIVGHSPSAHAERSAGVDYTALDRMLPHPVYAVQGWVCVLNPGERTATRVRTLLADAHARASRRYRRA